MNLKDFLELEEIKDTLIANALRWWITEYLERTIDTVMWWNVRKYPTIIVSAEHLELSACFKDGTPFTMIFKEEELRERIKEPCKPRTTRDIIREAFAIAETVPAMFVAKLTHGGWTVCLDDGDYSVEALDAEQLLVEVKIAKAYWEASQKPKKGHRTTRDIICEAYAIQGTCPTMIVEDLRHGGWFIGFHDNDYSVEVRGNAEELLAEVKEAKAYYDEASQKAKKGYRATRDMIHEAMEKAKNSDGEVIRIDGLDQETKELLLHFIEHLTIKDASDILAKDYPCSVWDEMHFIREKLRKSIAEPRRGQ